MLGEEEGEEGGRGEFNTHKDEKEKEKEKEGWRRCCGRKRVKNESQPES